jgi:acetyl-CoA C-acetyltransferase
MLASQAIRLGEANIVVAGGMENMSQAPHLARGLRTGWKLGDVKLQDAMILDGLWCAFEDCHMGLHAEYVTEKYRMTREELDRYSVESQQRVARAVADGAFTDEIVPVCVKQKQTTMTIETDEGPRPDTSLESLAQLKPAFMETGVVTAGNASILSDGAAVVVVADQQTADKTLAPWKARIVASYTSGTEPRDLFIAPVTAIQGVLKKAGLQKKEIDLYEINEAFASQIVACLKELDLEPSQVNVNGGAIALGHPIGASGCRILVTLLAALKRRGLKRGLASLCLGGGNAVAMIVERCDSPA